MKNLKGIIFDFDGTLADTLPLCILSFQQALQKITGRKYTENDITQHFGKSEEGIIAALAGEHYNEALIEYIETYRNNHYLCPDVFDGIIEILDELVKKNYKMALITGKGKHTIDIALEYMNLRKYFEYVEHGNPGGIVKTEGMLKILDAWKLNPSEVAYIGDQPSDITESRKAGVVSVAVSWAKTSNHQELMEYNPDFLFSEICQFKEWMDTVHDNAVSI
jgi:HAD superfamily hydrolase (TIGR01549 family)